MEFGELARIRGRDVVKARIRDGDIAGDAAVVVEVKQQIRQRVRHGRGPLDDAGQMAEPDPFAQVFDIALFAHPQPVERVLEGRAVELPGEASESRFGPDALADLIVADQDAAVVGVEAQQAAGDQVFEGGLGEPEPTRLFGIDVGSQRLAQPLDLLSEGLAELLGGNDRVADLGDVGRQAAPGNHVADTPRREADDEKDGQQADDPLRGLGLHRLKHRRLLGRCEVAAHVYGRNAWPASAPSVKPPYRPGALRMQAAAKHG